MPIVESDIQFRLSGGASNDNPAASLGGAISSEAIEPAELHNLFDLVPGAEAAAGRVEYRCLYVRNAHATLAWQAVVAYLSALPANPAAAFAIGLGTSAVNGTEQTVANETTAPTGVTFSTPDEIAEGLSIGNLPAGQHRAIWCRRTITAGSGPRNSDSASLACVGDTAE